MSLLNRVESAAEYVITYFFRKSAGPIQPVHIAHELVRVMLKNRQVSISHVYVPNIYRVHLCPSDHQTMVCFGETFLTELAKFIYDEGTRQGYTFLTLPIVEIKPADELALGLIKIGVEFNDTAVAKWQIDDDNRRDTSEDMEKTTVLPDGVGLLRALAHTDSRKSLPYLEVIKGDEKGSIYPINKDECVIGRQQDCDIAVLDLEISRYHLKLFKENNRWFVQDLGSTNGTYLNKLRVDRYRLNPGDRIKAGQTQFGFYLDSKVGD
ncbi:DUF3662 domain-containing protein [Dehalobacter sp. DCM]|uniref:FhaA domain-containing protein n=1 Tax=Dehalobacter sp. DCM TaxID=2907827 RepID=UPI003081BE7F|nr:DUF3662 domain-containing protein [Dehalobacter sp. DCM]